MNFYSINKLVNYMFQLRVYLVTTLILLYYLPDVSVKYKLGFLLLRCRVAFIFNFFDETLP